MVTTPHKDTAQPKHPPLRNTTQAEPHPQSVRRSDSDQLERLQETGLKDEFLEECKDIILQSIYAISVMPGISADSLDVLLDSLNSKVKRTIDDTAPVKVRKMTGKLKAPW